MFHPGKHPDVFKARWPGVPGRHGQKIDWAQEFTRIADPADVIRFLGPGLDMFWWNDGNRPRIWNGVPLAPGDPDPLTVAGVPVAEVAPYQLRYGSDVALEGHTGASGRQSLVPRDPAVGQDAVVVVWGRTPRAVTTNGRYLTTRDSVSGQGIEIFGFNDTRLAARVKTAGGAAVEIAPAAGHIAPSSLFVGVAIVDRSADTISLWTPGGSAGPTAFVDGAITGIGIGLGIYPGVSLIEAGAGLLGCGYLIGASIAPAWAADSYAKCKRLLHMLAGSWALQGGLPVFSRASARSRQDRNGRWWVYSPGMPAAGDSAKGVFSDARTNKCYRNCGIPVGALAEWIGDDASTATGVADAAALAAAGLADLIGTNVASYANASGASRYLRNGAASGGVTRHALSVFARIVAGAGAQIGWWSTTTNTFTAVGALTDAYVRTVFADLVPPDATSYFCIHVPDGCTVYWGGHQCEGSGNAQRCIATTPIPNVAAAATAARAVDIVTTAVTPRNDGGSYSLDITPLGWSGYVQTGDSMILIPGYQIILLGTGWGSWDGTNTVGGGGLPAAGVEQRVRFRWGAGRMCFDVNGTRISGAYDGGIYGALTAVVLKCINGGEIAVRNFCIYRNGSG